MSDTPTPPPASAQIPVSAADAHRLAEALSEIRGMIRFQYVEDRIVAPIDALSSAVPAGPAGEGGDPFAHVKVGDPDPDPDADGASCHAERKHGCTREHGHQGQHIATDGHRVLGVWTDTATPQQPAEAAGGPVLVARCDGVSEPDGVPCRGLMRFRWGMSAARCDTCGGQCGVAVARWLHVVDVTASPPASLAGSTTPGAGGDFTSLVEVITTWAEDWWEPSEHVDEMVDELARRLSSSSPVAAAPAQDGEDPRVDVLCASQVGVWEHLDEGARESIRPGFRALLARLDALASRVDTPAEGGDGLVERIARAIETQRPDQSDAMTRRACAAEVRAFATPAPSPAPPGVDTEAVELTDWLDEQIGEADDQTGLPPVDRVQAVERARTLREVRERLTTPTTEREGR